ncbi:hypothetical protein ACO0LV_06140 [Pseudactinotalea sp. Z1739]|uniref:hypothetical protein n=1 Tax=Pseudactinotalea sp. Z1739 TaxID=3413028 RepID=UPI003C7A14C0
MVTGTGEVLDFGIDDDASPATAPPPGSRPVGGDDGIARAGAGAGRTEDALLRAIGVSLGTIGVMTAVTIRATPEYDLRRLEWSAGAEWAIDHFLELSLTNRNADIYSYPPQGRGQGAHAEPARAHRLRDACRRARGRRTDRPQPRDHPDRSPVALR